MSEEAPKLPPRIQYRVAKIDGEQGYAVLFRHLDEPLWWHTIAIFASKERADTYAEVENDCAWDFQELQADETELPPTIEEPASGITRDGFAAKAPPMLTPRLLRPPPPAEKTAPEPTLTPEPEAAPPDASSDDEPTQSRGMVTGRAKQLWDYLCRVADGEGMLPEGITQVANLCGVPSGSMGLAWDTLDQRGFAKRVDRDGRWGVRLPDGTELWGGVPHDNARSEAASKVMQ